MDITITIDEPGLVAASNSLIELQEGHKSNSTKMVNLTPEVHATEEKVHSDFMEFNRRLADLMVQDFEREVALMLPHSGQAVCEDFGKRVKEFHALHCKNATCKQG